MPIDPQGKRLLVTGATGQQGGAVVRHTLAHGWQVRALTRDPNKPEAQALAQIGVEVVQGTFDNRSSLDEALRDVYGVFSVQTWEGTAEGIQRETMLGKLFAEAAADARVQHFVYSSVDGAERKSDIPHFECKFPVEQHIHELGLPATILRPVFFMENFNLFFRASVEQGIIAIDLRPNVPLQMIAVDDIGAMSALALEQPEKFLGTTMAIAGDELTMSQTAEILSRVLKRPIQYIDNPHMWQNNDFLSQEFHVMFDWYNKHGYKADISLVRSYYPQLMNLDAWLRKTRWGQETV